MTERPLSPEEKMMHAYILGKGAYSAIQAKNTLFNGPAQEEEEKLVIKLPKERLQQVKKSSLEDNLMTITQLHKGFSDKSQEHFSFKKNNLHKELEAAQEKYMKALVNHKKASLVEHETPHVDALCVGILETIEKSASESISDGSLSRSLKNLAHPVTKHIPSMQQVKETVVDKPLIISTIASLLLKNNLGKEEQAAPKSPMNVQVQAF